MAESIDEQAYCAFVKEWIRAYFIDKVHSGARDTGRGAADYHAFEQTKIYPVLSRRTYYRIIWELAAEYQYDDDMLTELMEIDLALMGHCAECCTKPFKGEPEDHAMLVFYVRSLAWK